MKYAIVYATRTGNTKQLAEAIADALPKEDCLYIGAPDDRALEADRLYVGFWTDKGSCDEETKAFLKKLTNQTVFLFGTAGFGGSAEYFDKILARAEKNLGRGVTVSGTYMCQGKMPMSVRERYEKMAKSPVPIPNIKGMIENFDQALTHPDGEDIRKLMDAVRK